MFDYFHSMSMSSRVSHYRSAFSLSLFHSLPLPPSPPSLSSRPLLSLSPPSLSRLPLPRLSHLYFFSFPLTSAPLPFLSLCLPPPTPLQVISLSSAKHTRTWEYYAVVVCAFLITYWLMLYYNKSQHLFDERAEEHALDHSPGLAFIFDTLQLGITSGKVWVTRSWGRESATRRMIRWDKCLSVYQRVCVCDIVIL